MTIDIVALMMIDGCSNFLRESKLGIGSTDREDACACMVALSRHWSVPLNKSRFRFSQHVRNDIYASKQTNNW